MGPWIRSLLRVLLVIGSVLTATASAAERPNVVLIITDDQGTGDFGVHGNRAIRTPHLDGLARQSASLSTFYVCPVCSPTRASLLTGRYHFRTRCIDTYVGRSQLEPAEITIGELFSSAGYATGVFGKWHLGDCYPHRPSEQGFAESLIHRGGGLAQSSDPPENRRRYTNPLLYHNNRLTDTQGYCTNVYFSAGIRFIEAAVAKGQNFLAYFATNAPHSPLHDVPEETYRQYLERKDALRALIVGDPKDLDEEVDRLARIAAMITNIDENVGRLLTRLKELHVADNTIVIFMIDNGPDSSRYVRDLRGKKTEVYEGGVRSPFWIRWPRRLAAGTTRPEPAAHIDVAPTLLAACQIEAPEQLRFDGENLLPLLTDASEILPDRPLVIQAHRGNRPVRYHHCLIRHGPWKLLNASSFHLEQPAGPPKWELYHVATDPGESRDLAAVEPDIVAKLRSDYDRWFDDVSTTRPDNFAPPRIHLGTPHENPTVLTRQDWRDAQAQQPGAWHVKLEEGTYEVTVLFDSMLHGPTEVSIQFGNTTRSEVLPAGTDRLVVSSIPGESGPGIVQVHAAEKQIQPYQVSVRRM